MLETDAGALGTAAGIQTCKIILSKDVHTYLIFQQLSGFN